MGDSMREMRPEIRGNIRRAAGDAIHGGGWDI